MLHRTIVEETPSSSLGAVAIQAFRRFQGVPESLQLQHLPAVLPQLASAD